MLSPEETILLGVLLVVLMAGMGASLTLDNFREVLRNPRGPLIGLLSQYWWMPLIAYGLASALGLPSDLAISLVVVGCTPGGTTSNLFTYFAGADVALSVSMTALSTVAAVVMMPLTLYLYATPFSDADLKIPYGNITASLGVMLVPLALGMLVRAKAPRAAKYVEAVGGLSGIAVILVLIASGLYRNFELVKATTGTMLFAAIGLGVLGFAFGHLGAALLDLEGPQRRAIAFETGIQNSPLAIGVLIASFPAAKHERMLWLPLLYALFVIVTAALLTVLFRLTRPKTS